VEVKTPPLDPDNLDKGVVKAAQERVNAAMEAQMKGFFVHPVWKKKTQEEIDKSIS